MKHRKPMRPDWRNQPAKRTIPSMTEWQLLQFKWKRLLPITVIGIDLNKVTESILIFGKVVAEVVGGALSSVVRGFRTEPTFVYKVDHPPYLISVDLVGDKGGQSAQVTISRELKHP